MTTLKLTLGAAFALGAALTLSGCGPDAAPTDTAGAAPAGNTSAPPVVIYTNADEEAQVAMKNALDKNGLKGAYLMQGFGTSELGGKLVAEGTNIEADVVTISTYYLESLQKQKSMFLPLEGKVQTINPTPDYYAPILGLSGSLFVNTQVLKDDGLKAPASIEDLADPAYAGHIAVPDIMGSSTSWLMTQAMIAEKGEEAGAAVIRQIEKNAGAHLEKSGSGPLKKIRAGEVAVGFGLRHQAVADKAKGLPIDFIDPKEGNFTLMEAAAVVNKGEKTNPNAQKVVQTIIQFGRTELLRNYPVALYPNEKVTADNQPANPKQFPEPLTVELLQKHQNLVKGQ